jgi:purine-binding chemotaxis protein CheW
MGHSYLTCRLGTEWYGVDVQSILEVVHLVALNDVYTTSPHVLGLMTLRQMLIPVLDLRQRFGLADSSLTLRTPLIAVHTSTGNGAFVVDETDAIVQIDTAELDAAPLPGIQGAVRLDQRTLFLLNVEQLLQEVRYDVSPDPLLVQSNPSTLPISR